MRFSVVAGMLSDTGCLREINEDFVQLVQPADPVLQRRGVLAIVADGVGGSLAGEVASRVAVDVVQRSYFASDAEPREALEAAFQDANREIYEASAASAELRGMGSTCTALVIHDSGAHSAHVGDSRMYLLRSGSIYRLTEDHSLASAMVKDKLISAEAAERHASRKVILRALGSQPEVQVACWERALPLRTGDAFVLCTDGLHDLLRDEEIRDAALSEDPAAGCDLLVSMAKERGGYDNITVAIVRVLSDNSADLLETRAGGDIGGATETDWGVTIDGGPGAH